LNSTADEERSAFYKSYPACKFRKRIKESMLLLNCEEDRTR